MTELEQILKNMVAADQFLLRRIERLERIVSTIQVGGEMMDTVRAVAREGLVPKAPSPTAPPPPTAKRKRWSAIRKSTK